MTNTTTAARDSRGFGRRRFLAGTAGAATLALAGCLTLTPLAADQSFGPPQELIQMGGRERHLVFGDPDDPDVTVTVRQDASLPATPDIRPEWIPFHLIVHHREGLRTDRLTLRLRAPAADGSDVNAHVYLRSPATGAAPSFTLDRTADGWTIIDSDDLGSSPADRSSAPGEANLHLYVGVTPLPSHPPEELFVDADVSLSDSRLVGRRSRRATGRIRFPFVRA